MALVMPFTYRSGHGSHSQCKHDSVSAATHALLPWCNHKLTRALCPSDPDPTHQGLTYACRPIILQPYRKHLQHIFDTYNKHYPHPFAKARTCACHTSIHTCFFIKAVVQSTRVTDAPWSELAHVANHTIDVLVLPVIQVAVEGVQQRVSKNLGGHIQECKRAGEA